MEHPPFTHSNIFALAYPSLIVMFFSFSLDYLSVDLLVSVCVSEVLPCETCPIVPMFIVAYRDIISG